MNQDGTIIRRRLPHERRGALAAALLVLIVLLVYVPGVHPGVSTGDMAELQMAAPLFGICHPPGYQTEVTLGGLFSRLPLGGGIAWRLNLLMALCGAVGCLALYGAVLRVTGRALAAFSASATLAFSVTYWSFSLVTEAYVFYAMFLLLALYTSVRFIQEDRDLWLWLTMLAIGACVGDRSSEAFVLPAFVCLWLMSKPRPRLGLRRVAVAIALLALPFAISVASLVLRSDPSRLANRDDFLRDQVLGEESVSLRIGASPDAPLIRRVADAAAYGAGAVWAKSTRQYSTLRRTWLTLRKSAWLYSGAGAWGTALYPGQTSYELRGGSSIGLPGIALALIGTVGWRRRPGWLCLGWGIFLGNLVFVLWYYRWDNLTFTIPGTVGLAVLVGLGVATIAEQAVRPIRRAAALAAALIVPALLLAVNAPFASQRTAVEEGEARWAATVAAAPWPRDSAIIMTYWPTMTLRYVFYVEGGRPDIATVQAGVKNWAQLVRHFAAEGRPVYIPSGAVRERDIRALIAATPREISEAGFVRVEAILDGRDRALAPDGP